jgi:phage tail protein X
MIVEVIEHITREGDRWDLLAWEYYGDATQYEGIIAANNQVMIDPILPSGIIINIPVLEEPTAELDETEGLPPWLT